MADIPYRFKLRRALASTWSSLNDLLLDGELGWERDTGKLKTGDGNQGWNDRPYIDRGIDLSLLRDVDTTDREDSQALIWDATLGKYRHGNAGSSYVAGDGIDIDATDPDAPVISSNLGSIALSGRVTTYVGLPSGLGSGDAGDAYLNDDDGRIYIWSGTAWPVAGAGIVAGGAAGTILQVRRVSTNTTYAITASWSYPTSLPSVSDGIQITALNLSFTPRSAASKLRLKIYLGLATHNTSLGGLRVGIFEGSTCVAFGNGNVTTADVNLCFAVEREIANTSIATRNFSVRCGTSNGTAYLNRTTSVNPVAGSLPNLYLEITEVAD